MTGTNRAGGASPSSTIRHSNAVVYFKHMLPFLYPSRGRDELAFLPAALEIIDTPASPVGRGTALAIVGAAVFALVWALLGKVDIVVTAQGRIEPIGDSKTIQPFQIGVVQSILVEDNQKVFAGQPLIVLDPTISQANVSQSAYSLLQARLDESRLSALRTSILNGEVPALVNVPADASPIQIESTQAAMQSQYYKLL
jgi:hemolysin D